MIKYILDKISLVSALTIYSVMYLAYVAISVAVKLSGKNLAMK